jgi:hypothetical protein
MMENILKTTTRKLSRFGLMLEQLDDVDFLPDEFFNRGFPSVRERNALVREFELAKGVARGMPPALPRVPLPSLIGVTLQ